MFGFVYRSVYIVSILQTFKRDDGFLQMNHCVQMAKSFCRYCQKQKKGKYLKIKPLKCLAFLSNVHFFGGALLRNFNKKLKGFTQGLRSYQCLFCLRAKAIRYSSNDIKIIMAKYFLLLKHFIKSSFIHILLDPMQFNIHLQCYVEKII